MSFFFRKQQNNTSQSLHFPQVALVVGTERLFSGEGKRFSVLLLPGKNPKRRTPLVFMMFVLYTVVVESF